MTILHISNKPVYPTIDGGCVAMAQLLESLGHVATKVEHICLNTSKHPFIEGTYPEAISFALAPENCWIDTKIRAGKALKSLMKGKNYNLSRFYVPEIACKLRSLVASKNYDVIVFESIYAAVYMNGLRTVSAAQMIIRMHNIEHNLWIQQAAEASFPKKSYLRSLAKSLKQEEIQLLNYADRLWTITREDDEMLHSLSVKTASSVIRVAIANQRQLSTHSADFFHLGSMNWEPNRNAVHRLLHHIWPKLQAKNSPSTLHLAGSFFSSYSFPRTDKTVFHGQVDDAYQFMAQHGILVTPVTSGSGIRIKLLEAMSLGIPCITTPIGAAGIDTKEAGIVIAETDAEWVEAMLQLMQSETLRKQLGEKARSYMEKYHSFAAINEQIRQEIEC